jgi:hypothetical protein
MHSLNNRMKKILFISILLLEFFLGCAAPAPGRDEIRRVDIKFQTSLSGLEVGRFGQRDRYLSGVLISDWDEVDTST